MSPNPHTNKVDNFIKGFVEGNSNSAKTLKLRKSVQIAEKPKKRLISIKTIDVDGDGKDSKSKSKEMQARKIDKKAA